MPKKQPEYICPTCQNCMKVKEKNNNITNEYKRCLHDHQIDCDAVIECNMHGDVKNKLSEINSGWINNA